MMNAEVIDKIAAWAVDSTPDKNFSICSDLWEIIGTINPSILDLYNKYDEKCGLGSTLADACFRLADICYIIGVANGVAVGAGYNTPAQVRPIVELMVRSVMWDTHNVFEAVKDEPLQQNPREDPKPDKLKGESTL